MADDVSVNIYNARPAFWASDAGLLAHLSGSPPTKSLIWLSRDGKATQVAPEDAYWNLRLSPDASRMAVSKWEPASFVCGSGNGAGTRRVQISTGGWFTVRWRGDGRRSTTKTWMGS